MCNFSEPGHNRAIKPKIIIPLSEHRGLKLEAEIRGVTATKADYDGAQKHLVTDQS